MSNYCWIISFYTKLIQNKIKRLNNKFPIYRLILEKLIKMTEVKFVFSLFCCTYCTVVLLELFLLCNKNKNLKIDNVMASCTYHYKLQSPSLISGIIFTIQLITFIINYCKL